MLHAVAADGRRTCLHSSCHAANLTDELVPSTVPNSSRKEPPHGPAVAVALEDATLVQAERAGVPELDAARLHAAAGPVRRTRHRLLGEPRLDCGHARAQLAPCSRAPRSAADAHAPIWLSRARDAKYASASASLTGSTRALDADLYVQRCPIEAERGARRRGELASLAAVGDSCRTRSRARRHP